MSTDTSNSKPKPNIYIDAGNENHDSDTNKELLTKIALVKACNNVDNVYVLATKFDTNKINSNLNTTNLVNASSLYSKSVIQPTSVAGDTHKIIFLKHTNKDVIKKIVTDGAIGNLDGALIVYYETEDMLMFLLELFIAKANRNPDETPMADFYITARDANAKASNNSDSAKFDKLLEHIMHDSYSAKGVKVQMLMDPDYGTKGQLRTSSGKNPTATGGGFFTGTKSEMKMAELIMRDISRGKYKGTTDGTLKLTDIGDRLKKYYEGEYKKENKKTVGDAEKPSMRFTKAALEMVIGMYRDTLDDATAFDTNLKETDLSVYGIEKARRMGLNKNKIQKHSKTNKISKTRKELNKNLYADDNDAKTHVKLELEKDAFYIMHKDKEAKDGHTNKPNRIVYNNANGLALLDNLLAKHITDVDEQTRKYYENNTDSLPGGKIHDIKRKAMSYKKQYNSRKAKHARSHRDKPHSKKQAHVNRTSEEKALNLMRPTDLANNKFKNLPIIKQDTKVARAQGLLDRLKGFKKPRFFNRLGGLTRKRAINQAKKALSKAKRTTASTS